MHQAEKKKSLVNFEHESLGNFGSLTLAKVFQHPADWCGHRQQIKQEM